MIKNICIILTIIEWLVFISSMLGWIAYALHKELNVLL